MRYNTYNNRNELRILNSDGAIIFMCIFGQNWLLFQDDDIQGWRHIKGYRINSHNV